MDEINSRKRNTLNNKLDSLNERWRAEYTYTCYHTYLDKTARSGGENEEWREIQNSCLEIIEMHWEEDAEYLKRKQAEVLCKLGILYMEKGDLDRACEALEEAENIMENFSLQQIIPKYYIWTCMYIAQTYTEKHCEHERIEQYCEKAKALLEQMSKSAEKVSTEKVSAEKVEWSAAIERKLWVEWTLLWIIVRSNAYKVVKDTDFVKEEPQIEKQLSDVWRKIFLFEQECVQDKKEDDTDRLWIRKQIDTYWASKGVYYKWLYFTYKDNIWLEDSRRNRNRCFEIAVNSFVEGIKIDRENTICAGNIAALLYNYQTEIRKCSGKEEDSNFFHKFLCKISRQLGTEKVFENAKECILFLLDSVFQVDQNNMFALNLHAMVGRSRKDEAYPYLALRQSSLRRRFAEMDRQLPPENGGADDKAHVDRLRDIKERIIDLHTEVAKYMNAAIYPREKFKGLIVGHYTKSFVLPKLLRWEGNAKMRIRNVKHLNDPSEGALFMGYINQLIGRNASQALVKNGGESHENLIRNLLQIYEYKRREEWNQKSSVYMGCFSSRIDQLNMWSRYGDAGKGCCLCIDAAASFDESTAAALAEISTVEDVYRYKMEDNQYPLYMVLYLPGNAEMNLDIVKEYAKGREAAERKKGEQIRELCEKNEREGKTTEKIAREEKRCLEEANWWDEQVKLVDEFEELVKDLSCTLTQIQYDYRQFAEDMTDKGMTDEAFAKLKEEIINTIMMILDQVRFLVKDDAYRDEREYRVIQYSYEPEYEEGDEAIPKLYVNIEKELRYTTVVFGPLTQNYASDSAYVLNLCKKVADRKEGERLKLDVYKSEIPYCC